MVYHSFSCLTAGYGQQKSGRYINLCENEWNKDLRYLGALWYSRKEWGNFLILLMRKPDMIIQKKASDSLFHFEISCKKPV